MALNFKVTKQLDADVTIKKQIVYFKLNQFPPILGIFLSSFGVSDEIQKKFVKQWFYYDASTLETEASKNLADRQKKEKSLDQEVTEKLTNVMLDYKDKIKTTISSDTVDNISTHKITLILNKEVIDALEKASYTQSDSNYKEFKPTTSQSVSEVTMTYWIDKKDYYIRKLSANFTVKEPKTGARFTAVKHRPGEFVHSENLLTQTIDTLPFIPQPDQDIPVAVVMKFGKINEKKNIVTPSGAVQFETFVQKLVEEQSRSGGGLFAHQFEQANNTKRRADVNAILNSINQYMADNKGAMPKGITSVKQTISKDGADLCSSLVPVYLAAFPVDPNINTGRPIEYTGCSGSYYTGYTVQVNPSSGRVTVAAPFAELGESVSVTR